MSRLIGAAVFGLLGVILLGVAIVTPAPALPAPTEPSLGWVKPTAKPGKATAAEVPPAVAPAHPAPVPAPAKAEAKAPEVAPPAKVEPAPAPAAKPAVPAKAEAAAKPAPAPAPLAKPATPPAPKVAAAKPEKKAKAESANAEEGSGVISFNSTPAEAEVYLDGANIGVTPMEIDVPSGDHRIKLVNPETGAEKKQGVKVKAGKTAEVNVTF